MKTLPTQLKVDGFDLEQIAREGNVAIFRQSKPGKSEAFEVVRIRVRKASERTLPTGEVIRYEESEVYPNSDQWGELGWTYRDREAAFEKLKLLQSAPI